MVKATDATAYLVLGIEYGGAEIHGIHNDPKVAKRQAAHLEASKRSICAQRYAVKTWEQAQKYDLYQ